MCKNISNRLSKIVPAGRRMLRREIRVPIISIFTPLSIARKSRFIEWMSTTGTETPCPCLCMINGGHIIGDEGHLSLHAAWSEAERRLRGAGASSINIPLSLSICLPLSRFIHSFMVHRGQRSVNIRLNLESGHMSHGIRDVNIPCYVPNVQF